MSDCVTCTVTVPGQPCLGCGTVTSKPYLGQCDGCETRAVQTVRRVKGSWGSAVVCRRHETEVD